MNSATVEDLLVDGIASTSANVSWRTVADGTDVTNTVLVKPAGGDTERAEASAGPGPLSKTLEGLDPATTYFVRINVTGPDRASHESPTVNFTTTRLTLASVPNLTVTPLPGKVRLGWTQPADPDLAGYVVWRSQSEPQLITVIDDPDELSYEDAEADFSKDATYSVEYFTEAQQSFVNASYLQPSFVAGSTADIAAGTVKATPFLGLTWAQAAWMLGGILVVVATVLIVWRFKRRAAAAHQDERPDDSESSTDPAPMAGDHETQHEESSATDDDGFAEPAPASGLGPAEGPLATGDPWDTNPWAPDDSDAYEDMASDAEWDDWDDWGDAETEKTITPPSQGALESGRTKDVPPPAGSSSRQGAAERRAQLQEILQNRLSRLDDLKSVLATLDRGAS